MMNIVNSYQEGATNASADQENNEKVEQGAMKKTVYITYLRAGGSACFLVFLFFVFIVGQVLNSGSDVWAAYRTNADFMRSQTENGRISKEEYSRWANDTMLSYFGYEENGFLPQRNFIYIHSIFIGLIVFMKYFQSTLFMCNCWRAGHYLHNLMFENIIRTNMLFFNTNPSGKYFLRYFRKIRFQQRNENIYNLYFRENLEPIF